MKQCDKFKKIIDKYSSMSPGELIFRVYCLERYIERLDRIYNDCRLVSDEEASAFVGYLKKGGFYA